MDKSRKRHRLEMPEWFTNKHAHYFRKNIEKEEWLKMYNAISGVEIEARSVGIDPKTISSFWYKSKKWSINGKSAKNANTFYKWESEFLEKIKQFAPSEAVAPKYSFDNPKLAVINPCDTHFGKYANGKGLKETKEKFIKGIKGIASQLAKNKVEQIIFVGGNDVLHTDGLGRTTTSGTPQDTDGNWYDAFDLANECYQYAIDTLSKIAPIHYVHCMSNHDYVIGYTLSKALQAFFSNYSNVTFDVSAEHRKYVRYGYSLIGFSHGDGATDTKLADLIKTEAKDDYAKVHKCYWILSHLHHLIKKANTKKVAEEHGDVLVIRRMPTEKGVCHIKNCHSISEPDDWHKKKGYVASTMAIDWDLFDATKGLIGSFIEHV